MENPSCDGFFYLFFEEFFGELELFGAFVISITLFSSHVEESVFLGILVARFLCEALDDVMIVNKSFLVKENA